MKTQDSRRSRAPSSRGGLIPRQPGALTLVDFDPPNSEVMEQFPCVVDATTTRGLAALCKALPDRWEVAIKKGRASLPKPNVETTLKEVLERGSTRILPGGPHDVKQVSSRRSALGRLRDHLPQKILGDLDARGVEQLVKHYRKQRRESSSAVLSSDLTELRKAVSEARVEAGLGKLPPVSRAAQPRRRQGRATESRCSDLAEAGRMLEGTDGWLQALVLLRIVTTASDSALLRLRREDFDLDASRLRVSSSATRKPLQPEGNLLFGLPQWCVDQLRASLPGFDGWEPSRLLFPAKKGANRPQGEASHAIGDARDGCGCQYTTMRSLRLLAQSIHVRAPRALRRGTATARADLDYTINSDADDRVAQAQEDYAAWIVDHWHALHAPPVALTRVPRRANAWTAPEDPERRVRLAEKERASTLVPGCLPAAALGVGVGTAATAVRAQPSSAYSEVPIAYVGSAAGFDPIGALNEVVLRDQMGRRVAQGEERLRRALEELKQWKENSVSHADVGWLMSLAAGGGFMVGTAWADWRARNPNASEAQAEWVRKVLVALSEQMVVEMGGAGGGV